MSPWEDDFYGNQHIAPAAERPGFRSMLSMGCNCLRHLDIPRVDPRPAGREYWLSIWMALGKDGQRVIGAFESAIAGHAAQRDAIDA